MDMKEIVNTVGTGAYSDGAVYGAAQDASARSLARRTTSAETDSASKSETATAADREETLKSLRSAKDLLAERGVDLDFNLVGDDDELQVEVRDPSSGKLIRKLPPDELVKLSETLDQMAGVMVDQPI